MQLHTVGKKAKHTSAEFLRTIVLRDQNKNVIILNNTKEVFILLVYNSKRNKILPYL